ncbi:DsbA family oxidoreductase [Brevundimonas aveniformis]|uniref:DsbA family oxidoreductase n=1 Tax=Brevundimonas aveniformis TaxID=370977 RepID=UPI00041FF3EE|nr:DsbA family oxidoreductase [Brevundimonas aveniformis]
MTQTSTLTRPLKIDFVSDVVCPWCAVGLGGLTTALERLKADGITAEIHFQPFELNPQMAPEGENIVEHIGRKYGSTPEQSAQNRAMIRDRAALVGFEMNLGEASRIWNTFDAHRLIHWAGAEPGAGGPDEGGPEAQARMKRALLSAHFTHNQPLNEAETLVAAAEAAGLDGAEARAVLAEGRFADAVRAEEKLWIRRGINSVPAVVVENKWLISGGQPAEVFEQALRQMAAETAGAL